MKTKFHKYLSIFRKLRGYTQEDMACKLNVSCSVYASYERGTDTPDYVTLENISNILQCTLDELFGRNGADAYIYSDILQEEKADYGKDKREKTLQNWKLAVGVQDFRFLRKRNALYVDKTRMIEEFLTSPYQVTLITRPRRFGKTLNMSMLAEFLDCTKESAELFQGTQISRSIYGQEMNQYPVVFLSFMNVKAGSAAGMLEQLGAVLHREYERYLPVVNSQALSAEQLKAFHYIYQLLWPVENMDKLADGILHSIPVLCRTLEICFKKKVILLMDEYDTPFLSANTNQYYGEVRDILAGMFSFALKGNPSLERAMLTGIQRAAKENIFSGLNNLVVCTVKDPEYEDCFGFTEEEVRYFLESCHMSLTDDVKEMYDGYRIGSARVYNPWSVSCYAARKSLEAYWVNTSENSILKHALERQGETFAKDYRELMEQGSVTAAAELSTAYYERQDDASLWGLLLNAGMVTIQEKSGENFYKLQVPNLEVWKAFQELTAFYLQVEEGHMERMMRCLISEKIEKFAEEYSSILLELPSYHDLKDENSYHMMMLGMCAFLHRNYTVKSNKESGLGRSDILLYAKNTKHSNMILEFKFTKDDKNDLEKMALEAVEQIKRKKYDAGMNGRVYGIGLAHCKKNVKIKWAIV